MLGRIRSLYEDDTPQAHKFRYGLLVFDIVTVLFVIVTSFFPRTLLDEAADTVFGILILADFLVRFWLEQDKKRLALKLATWTDFATILSFLAPIAGEGLAFLRILRTLRLLRTYQLLARLRADFRFFREHEDVVLASINLGVFLFVMTGLIYATEGRSNPEISNYADALYFTVTTLTTTGFGVTLFLRLLQVLFRPSKVRRECEVCGLVLHDADAVHCKHCGAPIHIRTEGHV